MTRQSQSARKYMRINAGLRQQVDNLDYELHQVQRTSSSQTVCIGVLVLYLFFTIVSPRIAHRDWWPESYKAHTMAKVYSIGCGSTDKTSNVVLYNFEASEIEEALAPGETSCLPVVDVRRVSKPIHDVVPQPNAVPDIWYYVPPSDDDESVLDHHEQLLRKQWGLSI